MLIEAGSPPCSHGHSTVHGVLAFDRTWARSTWRPSGWMEDQRGEWVSQAHRDKHCMILLTWELGVALVEDKGDWWLGSRGKGVGRLRQAKSQVLGVSSVCLCSGGLWFPACSRHYNTARSQHLEYSS